MKASPVCQEIKSQNTKGIRFPKTEESQFYDELKKRVDNHFKRFGISPKGDMLLFIKIIAITLIYAVSYGLILSDSFGLFGLIALFSILGISKGLIGFNVVHDALHGALTKNQKLNRLLGYWFDLNGTSSLVWKVAHNTVHHTYTNIPGYDDDIDKAIWLRLSPTDKIYWFHKYQCYYAPFLYALISLNWVFYSDFAWFYREWKQKKVSASDLSIFLVLKFMNIFLFLALPMMVLSNPWWQIVMAFISMHVAGGLLIAVVFQLAHIVQGVQYIEPSETGQMKFDWVMHEMMTTSNFGINNRLLTAIVGGLNYQVEHHLFPQVSHIHYADISKILRDLCRERSIAYNEHASFTEALKSHFKALKILGRKKDCFKL